MKRNILFFVAAAFTLLLAASCNRKVEYQFTPYATVYHSNYEVKENVGELRIPVLVNNATGAEVQVAVKVAEGKAKEGVDYEVVSPVNGILTFSGETDSLDVVINITSFEGEFTGPKDFSVSIESLTDGLPLGLFAKANVKIEDLDHPLVVAGLVGEWNGQVNYATNPPTPLTTTLKTSVDPEDDTYTKLIVEGWEAHPSYGGYALPVTAVYDFDKSCLYILNGQPGWYVNSAYHFLFLAFVASRETATPLELVYDQAAGTLTQMGYYGAYNTIGAPEDQGFYSLYVPGGVFTKK